MSKARLLKKRLAGTALGVAAAVALTAGSLGATVLLTGGVADAAACGGAVVAGTGCTLTGTLTVTGGTLTLTSPASLTWADTLNGTNQSVVDTTPADQQLTVNDATGSGAGWHITASATTFTSGAHTLANAGTLVNTGSVTSVAATTAPSATCVVTCTVPTNTTTYPVALTTAAAAPPVSTIYDTSALTGIGQMTLGGSASANPIGWWLNVPSNTFAGTYTSTITMTIVSGP